MPYQRKCENWIDTFKEWTIHRSEASALLLIWAGIFTISSALRRKVAITKQSGHLGSWDCYPFLYIMVVGPSGMRKTTTVRYSFDLLDQVPELAKPPTFITVEGLIDDMMNAKDSSVYLVVEEFSDLMQKDYNGKMSSFLTSAYDGKANIRQKTKIRDLEFVDKPCINLFGGTTPEWIANNIPVDTLNGGFGSRFIWLYVDKLRRRRMYYREEIGKFDFNQLEKNLVVDLQHISSLEGAYTISDEAANFMEEWYQNLENSIKYKKLSGYIMRKPVFAHKLAMILHAAYSDEMELQLTDFKSAIELLDAMEPSLPKVFEGTGKNEYSLEMRDILAYIIESGEISEDKLKTVFMSSAAPAKLAELIDGLLMTGLVKSILDENNRRVFLPDKENIGL